MKLVVMKRKESAKTHDGHENQQKNDENDQALVSNEMTFPVLEMTYSLVTQQPRVT